MTIGVVAREEPYVGNGTSVTFAVPFQFFEIEVLVDGVVVTNYTISQTQEGQTGSITFATAPASGASVLIRGNTTLSQQLDLLNNDEFPAESVELAFDRVYASMQEVYRDVTANLRLENATDFSLDVSPANRLVITTGSAVDTFDTGGGSGLVAVASDGSINLSSTIAYDTGTVTRMGLADSANSTVFLLPASATGTVTSTFAEEADLTALEARVVVLETAPTGGGGGSGSTFYGSVNDTGVANNDLDDYLDNGWKDDIARVANTDSTPTGLPTDEWSILNVFNGNDDSITQIAWPSYPAVETNNNLPWIRARNDAGTWTTWRPIGDSGGYTWTDARITALESFADGSAPYTAPIDLGGNAVTNVADPTNPQDAATKNYVDTEVTGLIGGAPGALDTLNELAAAINDDVNAGAQLTALITLTGEAATSTDLGVMGTNGAVPDGQTIKQAFTFLDAEDDLIRQTQGVAIGASHLGTFPGDLISDNVSVKTALTELEAMLTFTREGIA